MKVNQYCKVLCRKEYTSKEAKEFQDFVTFGYRGNMILDSLPLAEINTFAYQDNMNETVQVYHLGYPVGLKLDEEDAKTSKNSFVLNNHLRFKILYNPFQKADDAFDTQSEGSFIVGYQVIPFSIKHSYDGDDFNKETALNSCTNPPSNRFQTDTPMLLDAEKGGEVIWTYDVEWVQSDIKWASRWDVYLQMTDDNIHWFSIVNSLVILIFLSGIVGLIMTRILRKDFARYNEEDLTDEERVEANKEMREETGWKLVYGDVFRPPPAATILSVYCGSGVQLMIMSVLTLAAALLGFLSPANKGALLSSVLFFFVLMGVPAGYVSARFCKLVKEPNHFKATLYTGLLFPGVCFAVFFFVNMVAWAKQSSSAVPFGTLVVLMLLWFGVSLPLIFLGAFLGFKREVIQVPVATSPIPRQIPPQAWYMSMPVCVTVGGLLPFGAVFVEMFFILSSIWQHRFYYMFGFLALVFFILVITCAEITIVLCYLHLCAEDPRWWWRSFLTSGSTAIYLFLYGAYHFSARSDPSVPVDLLAATVYFGYLAIMGYAMFVLTGFVGFYSCFSFIKTIYGSIKID
jgi:transmembrane 9 superfamily protein 2/4